MSTMIIAKDGQLCSDLITTYGSSIYANNQKVIFRFSIRDTEFRVAQSDQIINRKTRLRLVASHVGLHDDGLVAINKFWLHAKSLFSQFKAQRRDDVSALFDRIFGSYEGKMSENAEVMGVLYLDCGVYTIEDFNTIFDTFEVPFRICSTGAYPIALEELPAAVCYSADACAAAGVFQAEDAYKTIHLYNKRVLPTTELACGPLYVFDEVSNTIQRFRFSRQDFALDYCAKNVLRSPADLLSATSVSFDDVNNKLNARGKATCKTSSIIIHQEVN